MGFKKVTYASWPEVRKIVWERSQGRCEVSGLPIAFETFEAHHRRPKGMGGTVRPDTDTPGNALALHPAVHNGGFAGRGWPNNLSVHGNRSWSQPLGYLIPKESPEQVHLVPVWLHGKRWVLLGADRYLYL